MITIKDISYEWFQDYKKPSMFIAFPKCSFKCDKECGSRVCQNSTLASLPDYTIEISHIINEYASNPITTALVCGGLEPFDSPVDLTSLIHEFRKNSLDDVVIYTGYTKDELIHGKTGDSSTNNLLRKTAYDALIELGNIIIKFGRFVPQQSPHFDEVLGVNLASDNQYAELCLTNR